MMTTRTRKSRLNRIQKAYLAWLCDKIDRRGINPQSKDLAFDLYKYPFKSLIPNDDNRAFDGIKLRECFEDNSEYKDAIAAMAGEPCTMLEMMVALAQHMDFLLADLSDSEDQTARWFWVLVKNLGLELYSCDDPEADRKRVMNDAAINKFLKRTYAANGRGGLFPLKHPREDQRQVEIWYQMQHFIGENYAR